MTAMDFRGARKRARSLLAPRRPKDLSRSALTEDTLRDNIIAEAEQHSARFQSAVRKQPEIEYEVPQEDGSTEKHSFTWDGYGDTVRDVARALFGIDEPEIRAAEEVRPENRLGRDVLQFTVAEESFMDARPHAKMNEAEALYGAMAYADELRSQAGGILAEHVKRSEEMREASNDAQSADDMMNELRNRAKIDVANHGTVQPGTRRGIKQALKAQAAAQALLNQLLQQAAGSGQVLAAAQAAQAAAQAAQDAVDMFNAVPGTEPGQAHNVPPDVQMELAEKWGKNHDLRRIARMVGRMYRDMRFKRDTRTKNVPIEPVGITTGREIMRLLPHEMAKVHIPALRPLFIKEWSERKLLEYEMQGKLPAGKGPIITVCDGSGSMSGEPFIWASSLQVCLLLIALREKRAFAGIEFGSRAQLQTWYFPKGEAADPDRLIDFASHFFGGGTDTATGMGAALNIIENEAAFSTADIVLIGDGQDVFAAEDQGIRDRLRALDVRIHGITIMTGQNPYFEQMCEWHVDVTDLAGSNEATDAVAQNIT